MDAHDLGWVAPRIVLGVVVLLAAVWVVQVFNDGSGSTVDGWQIGSQSPSCQDRTVTQANVVVARGRCSALLPAADLALDAGYAGHAPVLTATLHHRGDPAVGDGALQYVAVFRLMDGSIRAIGVGWIGVSTEPSTAWSGPGFIDRRPVCAGGPGDADPGLHKECRGGPLP